MGSAALQFPEELLPFVASDPAVCAVFYAMKRGTMTRDQALVALAVHQTQKCTELMKIACDAVARSGPPIMVAVPRDVADRFLHRKDVAG